MRRPSRQVVLTVLCAVGGLCLAVLLAILTSDLSTQHIGLAGESPTAGTRLVAPAARASAPRHPHRRVRSTPTTSTAPSITIPAAPPAATPTVSAPPVAPAPTTTAPRRPTAPSRDDSSGSDDSAGGHTGGRDD